MLRGPLAVRVIALFFGLSLFSVAIVAMLESGLGLPPWDVFHQGIAEHTPLSLGQVTIVVGVVILVFAWMLGQPPGFGTVANTIVIGSGVDLLSELGWVRDLAEAGIWPRVGLLAAGIALFGVGSAFYIGAGLGAGPRDSMMLAITRLTRWRIGAVRVAIEVTVLVIGIILGGTVGIGTVAMALLVGPSVEASFWAVQRLGLAGPSRVPVEFDPLDSA
jgi:uncharacterized membrane protein YczE